MKSTLPPSGMRDFLPSEKAMREYVMSEIRSVYRGSGFREVETSFIENLENLTGGDGGENTKLIFKILKRGEKLKVHADSREDDLSDLGLRFDLTLPLVRFYANNKNNLPSIFKAIQMGPVFRAERPQKGRYRCFMQCDIDVIGDESNLAEIEIILTIAKALKKLGLKQFNIKMNDRRILKAMVLSAGFAEADFGDIAIILDKQDKIGDEGVQKELLEKQFAPDAVGRLQDISSQLSLQGLEAVKAFCPDGYDNLRDIISVVKGFEEDFTVSFDHTLVRGMGYYTSTIFEVAYGNLGYSVAGGGRYDKMIGSILGTDVPAVGFSIGFERIVDILMEENRSLENDVKIALLFNEADDLLKVMTLAAEMRGIYNVVSVYKSKKKLGKQLDQLSKNGYNGFAIYGDTCEVKLFDA